MSAVRIIDLDTGLFWPDETQALNSKIDDRLSVDEIHAIAASRRAVGGRI